jgi:hypothetical protein
MNEGSLAYHLRLRRDYNNDDGEDAATAVTAATALLLAAEDATPEVTYGTSMDMPRNWGMCPSCLMAIKCRDKM